MKLTCPAAIKLFLFAAAFALTALTNTSAQTEKIIYNFTGNSDGSLPDGGLIFDSKGNLYGTTLGGGVGTGCTGCGTVFELIPGSNGTWTKNVLYTFDVSSGASPYAGLVIDGEGNLYGTTLSGSAGPFGTVFELSPGPSGSWTEKTLYSFTGGADGSEPYSSMILDGAGNLYGVTYLGGAYGFGTVFEVVSGSHGTWTEKVLHTFTANNDGSYPIAPLTFDGAGNLYGTTTSAGPNDFGTVFELTPSSKGSWKEKVVYGFTGAAGGINPAGGLIFDSSGNLYGTSATTVFELTPGSNGLWTEKTLHTFKGGKDGAYSQASLVFDRAGNLFGTTYTGGAHKGTVFELKPGSNGTWTETILHRFAASNGDGTFPSPASLVRDASGNLYGTTSQGGTVNQGIAFEITP